MINMEKDSIQLFFEVKSHISFYNLTVSFTLQNEGCELLVSLRKGHLNL